MKELIKTKEMLVNEFNRIKDEMVNASKEEKTEKEKNLDNIRNEIVKIDTVISEHNRDFYKTIYDGSKTIIVTGINIYLVMLTFKFDADFTTTSTLGKTILGNLLKK